MAFVSVVASAMHAASEAGALCKLSIAGRGAYMAGGLVLGGNPSNLGSLAH